MLYRKVPVTVEAVRYDGINKDAIEKFMGKSLKSDTKLVYQLLAHICTLDFPDDEGIKELIMPFAVKSHRAVDLGLKEEAE